MDVGLGANAVRPLFTLNPSDCASFWRSLCCLLLTAPARGCASLAPRFRQKFLTALWNAFLTQDTSAAGHRLIPGRSLLYRFNQWLYMRRYRSPAEFPG